MTVEHPVVPESELVLQTDGGKSEGFRTNRKDPSGRPEVENSPNTSITRPTGEGAVVPPIATHT